MDKYEAFVKSGGMQKAVNKAVLEAAAIAQARGLPPAGRVVQVPAFMSAALAAQPTRPVPVLSR